MNFTKRKTHTHAKSGENVAILLLQMFWSPLSKTNGDLTPLMIITNECFYNKNVEQNPTSVYPALMLITVP